LVGGRSAFGKRLDALFTAQQQTSGRDQADITGLIGQYAHGNEPSHNFAYLGNLGDRPMTTDNRVLRIMNEFYKDAPDGLIGNEDCGQMSAWYVWSAMGLYPICPGRPEYTTGVPLFDKVTINATSDHPFTITSTVHGARSHVESITLGGKDLAHFRTVPHTAIANGGQLHFDLGAEPGSSPPDSGAEPMVDDDLFALPAPIISGPSVSFFDPITVSVSCIDGPWTLKVTTVSDDDHIERPADKNLGIDRTTTVKAHVEDAKGRRGPEVSARYIKADAKLAITLGSTYANQYSGGGNNALVDGLRGGTEFRASEWQGYQGQDVNLTIDLGSVRKLKRAGLSVLQDQKSWIWLPSEVIVATSTNGEQWSSTTVTHDVDRRTEGMLTRELWTPLLNKKARYISIKAKNAGPCPDWHPSKGGSTWIFADEVLIELDGK
ncbi:MAG TPA: glycoside hydrolase family 92 protein, partial [Flavobacteriales bacterium]|nr:glycoside hydrolase family 92 protein [Flavobacteriales bacterium]